ncbi:MAG: transcriptional regulator [Actinomycetota bacterium]|nr:transcriptional regulator [Actinomycetota bacterium]
MTDAHDPPELEDQLASVGALHDPVRRSLYLYVASRHDDVSREDAAEAVGIQRQLAAFHLDKLVEAGLLDTSYRRLTGRSGPGAGRPAKLYRRSPSEYVVSLPPRQYDLAAELLSQAVEEADDRPAREALREVASRFGQRLGAALRDRLGRAPRRERQMEAIAEALARYGYEPRCDDGALRLKNCPFASLAEAHRTLVCGMNLNLVEGVVDGMGAHELEACRQSRPGECCVSVRENPSS